MISSSNKMGVLYSLPEEKMGGDTTNTYSNSFRFFHSYSSLETMIYENVLEKKLIKNRNT